MISAQKYASVTSTFHSIFKEPNLRTLYIYSKFFAFLNLLIFAVFTSNASAQSTPVNGVCPYTCQSYNPASGSCAGLASDACPAKTTSATPVACPAGTSLFQKSPPFTFIGGVARFGVPANGEVACMSLQQAIFQDCPAGSTLNPWGSCITCKIGLKFNGVSCHK